MFCIAAFLVLLVAGAVSAKYRRLLRSAWACVARRATFRPCDSTFKEDTKARMLAPLAVRAPGLVRPASIAIEVVAVLLVASTIWSGYVVAKSGLNLFVYGTCEPQDAASCTLAAEACSVGSLEPGFLESIGQGDVLGAFGREFGEFGETIAAIPSRLKNWDATEYLPENVGYLAGYDPARPTALEVIDPGCIYCKKLYGNLEESGFTTTHNVAYIAYPIAAESGYKFRNSMLVTQYLEAAKLSPANGQDADALILDRLFAGEDADGKALQDVMNSSDPVEALELLHGWLRDAGYSDEEIGELDGLAASEKVADIVAANRVIVEDRIDAVSIPTIIFDGARHGGVVAVDDLRD